MKTIVAGHEAVTATEFAELALGIDLELFTGSATESAMDRAARLDVAHEVLAELRESDPRPPRTRKVCCGPSRSSRCARPAGVRVVRSAAR